MNKVLLVGNLTKDPTPTIIQNDIIKSSFSIAVNDLKRYSETYFFNCIAWNQTAKYINENLIKGQTVCIDGRLTQRTYVNNENKTINVIEILVDNIKIVGANKKNTNKNEDNFNIDNINTNEIFLDNVNNKDSEEFELDNWEE